MVSRRERAANGSRNRNNVVPKPLVIVESPAKAKKIEGFLGSDARVLASYGHVRDLPSSAKEVPKSVTNRDVRRLGIDVEDHFKPVYVIPDNKKERVRALKDALKDASEVYLATDEDREGEAISWHVLEVLKPTVPVKRMVFHEITAPAIQAAFDDWRDLDMKLVEAQEGRRILDRLFGYEMSLVARRRAGGAVSAGRVQSVAARLVVERERGRMAFRAASYWDLAGVFQTAGSGGSSASFPPGWLRSTASGSPAAATSRRPRASSPPRPRSRCSTKPAWSASPSASPTGRSGSPRWRPRRRRNGPSRRSPRRRSSRRRRASSASARPGRCRWRRPSTRPGSSPICAPTRPTSRARR